MKKSPIALVCGLAAILLTVVLFLLILGNPFQTAMHGICFGGILLAELISLIYALCAHGNPRKVAAAVVSCAMVPYAVILSAMFLAGGSDRCDRLIGWYGVGLIVINALSLTLTCFDAGKSKQNNNLQAAKGNMRSLCKIVRCIMADPAAAAYSTQLRALEDKLEFSKDTVVLAEDERIRLMLLQLKERIADPNFDSKQMLQQIEKAIDTRNIMAK